MPITRRSLPLLLAVLATAAVPATALAKHGDDDGPGDDRGGDRQEQSDDRRGRGGDDDGRRDRREVRVAGRCTGGSTAKLKVEHDDGRLEAEFEVDQNRNGVTWKATLRRNGHVAVKRNMTTRAPSGSWSLHSRLANGAGADTITARATSPSGEVCTARVSI